MTLGAQFLWSYVGGIATAAALFLLPRLLRLERRGLRIVWTWREALVTVVTMLVYAAIAAVLAEVMQAESPRGAIELGVGTAGTIKGFVAAGFEIAVGRSSGAGLAHPKGRGR